MNTNLNRQCGCARQLLSACQCANQCANRCAHTTNCRHTPSSPCANRCPNNNRCQPRPSCTRHCGCNYTNRCGCNSNNRCGCYANNRCSCDDSNQDNSPTLPIHPCMQYPDLPVTVVDTVNKDYDLQDVCQTNDTIYYLQRNCEKIIAVNRCTHEEICYTTCLQFSHMTYDKSNNTFIACTHDNPHILYILNDQMEKIGCIHLDLVAMDAQSIVSLGYDCCDDTIIIAYAHRVIKWNKCENDASLLYTSAKEILSMACVSPCLCLLVKCNRSQIFTIINQCGNIVMEKALDPCYDLCCMELDLCSCSDCCVFTMNLYVQKKRCGYQVLETIINGSEIDICPNPCNYYVYKKPCEVPVSNPTPEHKPCQCRHCRAKNTSC